MGGHGSQKAARNCLYVLYQHLLKVTSVKLVLVPGLWGTVTKTSLTKQERFCELIGDHWSKLRTLFTGVTCYMLTIAMSVKTIVIAMITLFGKRNHNHNKIQVGMKRCATSCDMDDTTNKKWLCLSLWKNRKRIQECFSSVTCKEIKEVAKGVMPAYCTVYIIKWTGRTFDPPTQVTIIAVIVYCAWTIDEHISIKKV